MEGQDCRTELRAVATGRERQRNHSGKSYIRTYIERMGHLNLLSLLDVNPTFAFFLLPVNPDLAPSCKYFDDMGGKEVKS